MKLFTCLFVLFLGVSIGSGDVISDITAAMEGKYVEGQRYVLFPDGNHKLHLVDLFETEPDDRFTAERSVKFILHTRAGSQTLVYGDDKGLANSKYDKTKPTKIVIHGWSSNGNSEINKLIKEAFLKNDDLNVIVVDWGVGAMTLYTTACRNIKKVGAFVGKLVDWLVNNGTPLNNVHLIGHSLGAQGVGIAGRNIKAGKVPYISALDPANPGWGSLSDRVRPSDGQYVEVIHTDGGGLGTNDVVGHNDFYPNKGSSQPGCYVTPCSHMRAYEYFADSIDHTMFQAKQCSSYTQMKYGICSNLSQLHMGGSSPKRAAGVFLLSTNSKIPYYKG